MSIFSGILGGFFQPHRDDLNPSGCSRDAMDRADVLQKMIAVDPCFTEAYEKMMLYGGMIESGTDENGDFYVKHIPVSKISVHD
ncbi:hypothetical protein JY97_00620 [Alkalispirochaeta odontotermitis]|nr:hypothetical protein JY97_00620 [Alkalispirochaeta odontotermitis]